MPNSSAFLTETLHTAQDDTRPLYCDPAAWPNRLWRILGVPHNVLMAICSLHLVRKPYPEPWRIVVPERKEGRAALVNRGGAAALVALILLLCNTAGFLALISGARDKPTASMWMMMCLAVGALTGFLFAVPRLNTKTKNQVSLLPNRNIESISDWLTKILVGLGLVNLKEIGSFLTTRSTAIAPAFGTNADFALAFIVYFVIAGFLEGYLLTRMFLQWHFVDSLQTAASLNADDSGTLTTTSVPKVSN